MRLFDYLKTVDRITERWFREDGTHFRVWFRGQSNARWKLIPAVYRPKFSWLDDKAYRHEFQMRAHPFIAGTANEPANHWDWYFLMQHHGLPTRLLDWTESSLVALYFALRDATPKNDPVVWLIDPWSLNRDIAQIGNVVVDVTHPVLTDYLAPPYTDVAIPAPPVALDAPYRSRRITAQRGRFTLHGAVKHSIDSYQSRMRRLHRIVIPQTTVLRLRQDLRQSGVTETTVFPELSALCRELLDYWGVKYSAFR
jgi:hypothetical protein